MNEEHSTLSSAEQFDAIAATAYKEVAVMKGQDWKYKVVCVVDQYVTLLCRFPQGGIDNGETPIEAALRELYEETAIRREAVDVVAELPGWYHYDWPKQKQLQKKQYGGTNWRGQRQKWFLMRAKDVALVESMVDLSGHGAPQEFQRYAWVQPEHLLMLCREFKRAYFSFVIPDLQKVISGVAGGRGSPTTLPSDAADASNDRASLQAALQTVSVKDAMQAVVAKFGTAAVRACLEPAEGTVFRTKAATQSTKVPPSFGGKSSTHQASSQRQMAVGSVAHQEKAQPPFEVGSATHQTVTQPRPLQSDQPLLTKKNAPCKPTSEPPLFAVGHPANIPASFPVPSAPTDPSPVERSVRTSVTSNTSRATEEVGGSVDHTAPTRSELDNSFAGIIEGMPTEMMRAPPT